MPIEFLPIEATKDWLESITQRNIGKITFPLLGLLNRSFYYPSSGFDGDPIRHLGGNFKSFIYVDYGKSFEELDANLRNTGFRGYQIVAERIVKEQELAPNGWVIPNVELKDGDFSTCLMNRERFFCHWYIFELRGDVPCEHGPKRFSLLYMCQDGIIAYKTIFNANSIAPAAIAIIQPGYGFGRNWTDFTVVDSLLYRTVRENKSGLPAILLSGGYGPKKWYKKPCWPAYTKLLQFINKGANGNTGVWSLK
jgi:hypothetical protein